MKSSTREMGKWGKYLALRKSDSAIFAGFLNSGFQPLPPFPLSRVNSLLFAFVLFTPSAFADGGVVLKQEVLGAYRVTLFGAPSPLRAGPADLSVMVQDAQTGAPILNRTVTLKISAAASTAGSEAWVPPCCSMKAATGAIPATHAAAQNKLLYAANVLLPASGPHEITVNIGDSSSQPSTLNHQLLIQPPAPPLTDYWPYLAFPPLLIGGFALNLRLRQRR